MKSSLREEARGLCAVAFLLASAGSLDLPPRFPAAVFGGRPRDARWTHHERALLVYQVTHRLQNAPTICYKEDS
jgi:hypothetical protein